MKLYPIILLLPLLLVGPGLAERPRPSDSFADSSTAQKFEPAKIYDVQHTRLDLSVDMDSNRLWGTATHTLSANKDGLSSIPFDQHGITFHGVTTAEGHELEWNVEGDSLWITLPQPLRRHETTTVIIDYESSNRPEGTYWITPNDENPDRHAQLWTQGETHENRFWFPSYDSPNDLRTSEMLVTVRKPFTVVSNGALLSVTDKGENRIWHFKMDVPHVNYLQSLVIGEFDMMEETVGDVAVQSYFDPKYSEDASRAFGRTDDMIQIFNEKIGVSYPYPVYRQVTVDEYLFGGMEHVTATTLTERTIRDANAYQVGNSDALVAHELAHQWFGDYLTCQNWSHLWLNEGFATFMETIFFEEAEGRDRALWDMHNNQASALRTDKRYIRPMSTRYYESEGDMFDGISYGKGACVLHMLRNRLGDDLFWATIKTYVENNGPGNVISNDLRQAAYEVSGQPLERFFDQWVYRGGHPKLDVSWKWIDDNSMVRITIKQTQEVTDLTPLFEFPVELDFTGEDWHQNHRVWISEDKHTFYFQALERPKMVEFDRDSWILKDLTFKKSTKELLYQLEHSSAVLSRHWAVEELAQKHETGTLEALEQCLQNSDEFYAVREEAAAALGKIGSDKAFAILEAGLSLESPRIRSRIAQALAEFENEASMAVLRGIVSSDPSSAVVSEAIRSAGRIGGKEALAVIERGFSKNSWRDEIRRDSLAALRSLKDPDHLHFVYPYAKAGVYYETRESALETLGRLGSELDENDKERTEIRKVLERGIKSSVIQVQESAVGALRALGETDAIPALERVANGVTHRDVASACKRTVRMLRNNPNRDENRQRAVLERLDNLEKKNRNLEEEVESLRGRLKGSEEDGS